jgi:hypothetical protein
MNRFAMLCGLGWRPVRVGSVVRTVILEREGDYGNVSLCVEHYGQEWQGSALLRNLDPELPD